MSVCVDCGQPRQVVDDLCAACTAVAVELGWTAGERAAAIARSSGLFVGGVTG